jgi:hypothetical protein
VDALVRFWISTRWWVSQHYILAGAIIAVPMAVLFDAESWRQDEQLAGIGAVLGYIYFAQRQRLEKARLFKELFTEFNKRYDRLNDHLATIGNTVPLGESLQRKVVDYFNLCAEEHLFYRLGYIDPLVWHSWCRGMLQYLELESVKRLWDSEVATNSYYELTYAAIVRGAASSVIAGIPANNHSAQHE